MADVQPTGFSLVSPFGYDDFSDERLKTRSTRCLRALADGHLHHTPQTPALRRGLQRFIRNERVRGQQLLEASARDLSPALRDVPVLLSTEDTTLARAGKDVRPDDAGALRSAWDRGYVVHCAFGLRPGSGKPEAWLGAIVWSRYDTLHLQDHRSRHPDERESSKWPLLRDAIHARLKAAGCKARIVSLNDCEGDAWESLWHAVTHHHWLLTRAAQNRCLDDIEGRGPRKLKPFIARQPVAAELTMDVYDRRSAKHRPRKATLELRVADVTLRPPRSAAPEQREPLDVVALHLRERRPPRGQKRFESYLLATFAIETTEQAIEAVSWYGQRWGGSEVGHDILKNGLGLERVRVKTVDEFKKLVALEGPVAAQVAQWVAWSRQPEPPAVTKVLPRETLTELKRACTYWCVRVPAKWTLPNVVETLARLGGADVRPSRRPGWRVVLRGWRRFEEFRTIYAYARTGRLPTPEALVEAAHAVRDPPDESPQRPPDSAPLGWKILGVRKK